MTAIDIAVQSKRLGAERVDIAYRRGPEHMKASQEERRIAQTNGVSIHHWMSPVALHGDSHVAAIEFDNDGEKVLMEADVVFKAIGQRLADSELGDELAGIALENGKIVVDETQATSQEGLWAGGDCVVDGEDLTVSAVQHGKVAAQAIDRHLRA